MQFVRSLLDRAVFAASTDPIDPENRERQVVEFDVAGEPGRLELWGHRLGDNGSSEESSQHRTWVILKFPGTGGRAERASTHPAGVFPAGAVHSVWAVNPPGYGSSGGRPRLDEMPAVIAAAVSRVYQIAPESELLVTGNSLGCVWALFAAARLDVQALLLRNPFSLQHLIRQRWRYNWWNFGLARLAVRAIPDQLDAIANARRCTQPAMIVRSECDRMIPGAFQRPVIDSLAGRSQTLVIPGGDHGDPLPEELVDEFARIARELFLD